MAVPSHDGFNAPSPAGHAGHALAQHAFLIVALAPIILGILGLMGERYALVSASSGLVLVTAANIVAVSAIAWFANRQITAERALRRSQALLQAISDNSPAVIYVKDLDGRYLLVNQSFCDVFRGPPHRFLGKTDYDLFTARDADRFRGMDRRVAAAGGPLTEEEYVPLADGVHTYISVKSPLRDEAGRIHAVFGISTDITDRKRSEAIVQANEERTRLIIDGALDAVVTMDAAGAITGWNPNAETTFGWPRHEILGRTMADAIIPERYREAHWRGLEQFIATGEGPVLNRRIEISALHRDGREFPIELSIAPVRVGDTLSFSAFIRDITDRKLADKRLHAQLAQLTLLDRFTRAIAERQDLQHILQVVLGRLEDQLSLDFCAVALYDRSDDSLVFARIGDKGEGLARAMQLAQRTRIPIDRNGLSRCVRGQLVHEPEIASVSAPFPQRLAAVGLRSLVLAPLAVECNVFGILIAARHRSPGFSSGDCEFLRQMSEHVALAAQRAEVREALQREHRE